MPKYKVTVRNFKTRRLILNEIRIYTKRSQIAKDRSRLSSPRHIVSIIKIK